MLRPTSTMASPILGWWEKMSYLNMNIETLKLINSLIIDLINSDLISNVDYLEEDSYFLLSVIESDLIENIFINSKFFAIPQL